MLKDKYDILLEKAFKSDPTFLRAQNSAFEEVVNFTQQSPEALSLFIDKQLKNGLKGANEEEIEGSLNKVKFHTSTFFFYIRKQYNFSFWKAITLFRFIKDTDVFENYYKQHLAKRLLLNQGVSDFAERNMISKLKEECGYQFTSKLEGMFQDMKTSVETMEEFKKYLKEHPTVVLADIKFSVKVLTTGFWPVDQSSFLCILPEKAQKCANVFKDFYLGTHGGRRITWQYNMGFYLLQYFIL